MSNNTPNTPNITQVAVRSIDRSATNPRKHFDEAKLEDLIASVKAHGILSPLLVRPHPKKADRFELVCGERRWRAATTSGLEFVPVIVRHLEDADMLEIQVIENLQRDDLHPLEEAEGYERLIEAHGHTVADIAAKVGKDKSYIHKRIKLLALIPKAREAFFAGDISPSIALQLARLPDIKAQTEGLRYAKEKNYDGDLPTAMEVAHYLKEKFMLALKGAPFDIHDASLTAAGACSGCPKRTANQTDLFGDDMKGDDRCLDGACFGKKVDAQWARAKAAAKLSGQTVLEGKAAEEATGYSSDFVKLDERCWEDAKKRSWKQLLAGAIKAQTVKPVLARTKLGVVTLVARGEALKHSGLGLGEKMGKADEERKEQAKAAKAEALLTDAIHEAKTAAFVTEIEQMLRHDPLTTALARILADGVLNLAGHYRIDAVAARREAKVKGERPVDTLRKMTRDMETEELMGLVFELAVPVGRDDEEDDEIVKVVRVDFDGIEREARAAAKNNSTGARPEAPQPARVGKQAKAVTANEGGKDAAWAKGRAPVSAEGKKPFMESLSIPLPKGFKAEIQIAAMSDEEWASGYDVRSAKAGAGFAMESAGKSKTAALTVALAGILTFLAADMATPTAVLDSVRAWGAKHGVTKQALKTFGA